MKHFISLLILTLIAYVVWTTWPRADRVRLMQSVTKHAKPVAAIVLVLLAALVLAFYSPSFNVL